MTPRPFSIARVAAGLIMMMGLVSCGAPPRPPDSSPSCSDACPSNGAVQCVGNSVEQCAPASNGCLAWGAPVACGSNQTCSNGACAKSCSDACPTQGAAQCVGDAVETCQAGSDGCLAWSAPAACGGGETCSNGSCSNSCTNSCPNQGASKCVGNSVETCDSGSSGCLAWSAPAACGSNQVCEGGQCANTCGGTQCNSNSECVTNQAGGNPTCAVECSTSFSTASQCSNGAPCCAPIQNGTSACLPLSFVSDSSGSCGCATSADCAAPGFSDSACVNHVCSNQYSCNGIFGCESNCSDQNCMNACVSNGTSSAQTAYGNLVNCVKVQCPDTGGGICDSTSSSYNQQYCSDC